MVHQRVQAANLAAGDTVRVQCFNHEYNTVIHYAEYLVYSRATSIRRVEMSDNETRQVEDVNCSVIRTSDWKMTPAYKEDEPKVVWNLGKKKHEVKIGEKLLYEDSDKSVAESFAASYTG